MIRGERHSDLRLHLTLVHSRQVVLDRVLGGDDLHVGPVQLVERGVQGGRLTRTGRPGHQQDPVGTFDQLFETGVVFVAEAEVLKPNLDVVAVEDTHDH